MADAAQHNSPVPPDVAAPVVDRLREIAEAIDGPPSPEIDGLIGSLFTELQRVAGAVGVTADRRPLAGF